MEARSSGSGSLGCHIRCGMPWAKWTTCWPVPLAISSTNPLAGRTRFSTVRIGPLLRSAAGAVSGTSAAVLTSDRRSQPHRPCGRAGGNDEVVLVQAFDLLGLQRHGRIAPTEADVRMMAL